MGEILTATVAQTGGAAAGITEKVLENADPNKHAQNFQESGGWYFLGILVFFLVLVGWKLFSMMDSFRELVVGATTAMTDVAAALKALKDEVKDSKSDLKDEISEVKTEVRGSCKAK